MANKSEVKERSVFNKICSILIDILVIPVIIIAFVCSIFMSSAKANNKVPSILGNSIVEVLTNSMDVGTKESYKVGDVLIIDQNINLDELKVGDCIAFYAPKQSKFTTDGTVNGDSLVIFHRIVRIVYAREINNGVVSSEVKRHFVCHGDNAGSLEYIPTQAKLDGSLNPGGDYDINGNLMPGGGYVVKLLDDTAVAGDSYSAQMEQSTLQYVTDAFVVGVLKSRAGGFFSALVKFCCSEIGIILLVIIPASIMICLVLVNLIQEMKLAKREKEADQLILAKNLNIAESAGAIEEARRNEETQQEKAGHNKQTSPVVDGNKQDLKQEKTVESKITKSNASKDVDDVEDRKKTTEKLPKKSTEKSPEKVTAKKLPIVKPDSSTKTPQGEMPKSPIAPPKSPVKQDEQKSSVVPPKTPAKPKVAKEPVVSKVPPKTEVAKTSSTSNALPKTEIPKVSTPKSPVVPKTQKVEQNVTNKLPPKKG